MNIAGMKAVLGRLGPVAGFAGVLLLSAGSIRADMVMNERVVTMPAHVITVDDSGLPAQLEISLSSNNYPLAWRGQKDVPAALLRRMGRGPQFMAPARIEAVLDGATIVAKADAPAALQKTDRGVAAVGSWTAGELKGGVRILYAEDGSMAGQVTFNPADVKLDRLDLVLELSGPVDTAIAGNPVDAGGGKQLPASYGSLAAEPGMLWCDGKNPAGDGGMHKGRIGHFFLGTGDRGFTWLAGNDDGSVIGGDDPSMSVERSREGVTMWRIALVNKRARGGERTAAFTLLTHPTRAQAADRRLQQWQPWPGDAVVPALNAAARAASENGLVRAEAGSVYEATAARVLLAGPAGGDARSLDATIADSFPIGLFRYLAGSHTALAAQLRSNAAALATPGSSPAVDRMVLGRALLHDIGVDLAGLAGCVKAADIVSALETFGYFETDGQTEFLPYWRTDGIVRYGEDFAAEAKDGFAVTKENPAGRTRVSVFLRPSMGVDPKGGAVMRRKALFVVVNEGEAPVRENLYIDNPAYVFAGFNKVTVAAIYGQLEFSHIPGASDWRRREVLASAPDIAVDEVKAKVKARTQADSSGWSSAVVGQLQDMESGGYVQTTKQSASFAVCGPVYVPARGMRLLFGSGAEQAGIVGSVYKVALDGTRTPVSVPVHIFGGGVEVADKLDAIKKMPIAKLKSAEDGSFRLRLPAKSTAVTVVAEIDGKLYPDAQQLSPKGAYWPSIALDGEGAKLMGDGRWGECVIEAYEGAGPGPKPVEGPATPVEGKPWTSPVTGMEFVWVPAGKFMMGSPDTEPGHGTNETLHEVTLTKGFWMGKYEVTQGQWKRVMGYNPSHFRYAGDNAPVENVDLITVVPGFISTLNAVSKASGVRYRIPTEAEWEYACRAGTTNAIYTGPLTIKGALNGPELDEIAWYGGNSGVSYPGAFDTRNWRDRQYDAPRSGTHPVGQKKPNAWGLHDMLGNVSEWVYDMYTNLPPDSVTDPVISPYGPDGGIIQDARMVIRGGSWYRLASGCRSAFRQPDLTPRGKHRPPTDNYVGLRLVCELKPPEAR